MFSVFGNLLYLANPSCNFACVSCTQGKYRRRLYCDHVTKCFVSKCVIQVVSVLLLGDKHKLGQSCTDATWLTHLKTKHFSHMITIQAASILARCYGNETVLFWNVLNILLDCPVMILVFLFKRVIYFKIWIKIHNIILSEINYLPATKGHWLNKVQ